MTGTQEYTIEAWIYPTSFNARNENYIFDPRSSGATKGFAIGLNSAGLPIF